MNLKSNNFLSLLVPIAAIFASLHLINPNPQFLTNFNYLNFTTLSPSSLYLGRDHHHRPHKKHPDSGSDGSICDDFPPGIPPPNTNTTSYLCVDRKGCCNFTTVQQAVNAVPDFSLKKNIIWINSGFYYEKVTVPKTKPNITFQGQSYTSTAIAWNDTAKSANGTFYSGSVQVFASNFIAKNISFMNLAPIPIPGAEGAQAVAMRISGDQAEFRGCGFFGAQDTLHDDKGRHYFKDCYIQGSIDFIFGNARSLYENCQLVSIANPVPPGQKNINGAVTAHGRVSMDENTGYVFLSPWMLCTVTQIEETKQMIKMIPILIATCIPSIIVAQTNTLFVKQGTTLDRRLGAHFKVPPASLIAFVHIFLAISTVIYDRVFVPIIRRYTKNPRGITMLQRIGIGLVFHVIVMVVSCFIERKRLNVAREHNLLGKLDTTPLSIFILVPQFALMGIADTFVEIAKIEFFYDQAPESMKSLGSSYATTTFSMGNFLSTFLLSNVARLTSKHGHKGWILDNLNISHLDYYYAFLALLSVVNFFFFLIIAKFFVYNDDVTQTKMDLEMNPASSKGYKTEISQSISQLDVKS